MTPFPSLPPNPALLLDFDGTLVDIAATPDAVRVDPELPALLDRLLRELGGAIAVVSGRPLADIDHFLAPHRLIAYGLHGLEHRDEPAGEVQRAETPDAVARAKREVQDLGLIGGGVMFEDKGPAFAVHYRAAPERGAQIREALTAIASRDESLSVICGKAVVEIKPKAVSKGTAVRRIVELPAFRGRTPVFVGDDVTDEDGFAAVVEHGGVSIKVGEGATCAQYRLPSVAAVHGWLANIAC